MAGIYSTNRVMNESSDMRAIAREIDETPYDPNFCGLMECTIALAEADHMMFESMIQCDFISTMNEHTMSISEAEEANNANNEVKKNKIWEKIKSIFAYIRDAIKKAIANIIYKITDLLRSDEKIYKKYAPTLVMKNLEGFIGIDNFTFPKQIDEKSFNSLEFVKGNQFDDGVKKIADATDRDAVDSLYKTFEDDCNAAADETDRLAKKRNQFEEGEKNWKPSEDQLNYIKDTMKSGSDQIKNLKKQAKEVVKILNEKEKKAKDNFKSAKKDDDKSEFEVYKLNKVYQITSKYSKQISRANTVYINAIVKQIAACRKAFIICGRYAYKKAGGKEEETTTTKISNQTAGGRQLPAARPTQLPTARANEAAINFALGESSDVYVYEKFAY